ncbi:MAG: DUF5777 family beta-barrel protein [Prolixibacteraceae bacterium]|jgi:hypothetical protein|nr:DUF5777 family beta-barrel protein [Prolixibacteraceae bacterium]
MKRITILALLAFLALGSQAQSLEDLLDNTIGVEEKTIPISATFKSVQLINSHTTKTPKTDELIFLISHRFAYLNSGFSDLFGLDNATVRFGFEYGINDKFSLGFGRSTYKRNYDFFAKYALLQQSKGAKEIPVTVSIIGETNISSAKWPDSNRDYLFAHRMSYSAQLLIARKFNSNISVQLMPTYIHRNLVQTALFPNDILAIGAGGRFKVSNWIALTFEYHHMLNEIEASNTTTPLSIGVDLETGGHVFQLFFTNTSAIYAAGYISETSDKWMDGNIRFGFNISRTF